MSPFPITLEGVEFIRRFCQHILPQGFHKVRYDGLWNPKRRQQASRVRVMLQLQPSAPPPPGTSAENDAAPKPFRPVCPHCGCRELTYLRKLNRPRSRSP